MIANRTIEAITDKLIGAFGPEKVILFGSQARETSDERSDIDLLVVCSFDGKRRHLMVEMDRALDDIDYAFDILILTPEEFSRDRAIPGTIGRYADLEGRILYERN